MRKYYQALLLVTAVISVISLLIYRHEYNRLRYVLEVFNYFGNPGQKLSSNCSELLRNKKLDLHLDEPHSSWQRLTSDLFVFSAYDVDDGRVEGIGYGRVANFQRFTCHVQFDDQLHQSTGQLSVEAIKNVENGSTEGYMSYRFTCKYREKKPVVTKPVVLWFKLKNGISPGISLAIGERWKIRGDGMGTICVAPSSENRRMSKVDMISFLNFHELLGMDNFVVYDFGLPSHFNRALRKMSRDPNPYWKFTYATVSWSFPFADVSDELQRGIIEADCLLRTFNKTTYAVTLAWDEYLVMKYHHFVVALLKDFNGGGGKPTEERFALKTFVFCTQQKNHHKKVGSNNLIVLTKTLKDPEAPEQRPIFIYKHPLSKAKDSYTTYEASTELIFVNKYQKCPDASYDSAKQVYDSSILRFAGDMQNAQIYRTFKTGKLFLPET